MSLSGSGAPAVVLVFGLEDPTVRWLTRALRACTPPVMAVHVPADLPPAGAHSVCSAADAGLHVVSARDGMDATFLEYWQLLAEMGKARYVVVHDLLPSALDLPEVAAIASRVLEEDVHPITLPLLDDDEAVIGVLDVVTGQQWFPDGSVEDARDDFVEAVAAETNVLLDAADETGDKVSQALTGGLLSVAAAVDSGTRAGVDWLAAHMPDRQVPAASTTLPGDDQEMVLVAAGPDALALGPALAVHGTRAQPVMIRSLVNPLEPAMSQQVAPGTVAAARIEPPPAVGSLLVGD